LPRSPNRIATRCSVRSVATGARSNGT
jgi:hypothetical protein